MGRNYHAALPPDADRARRPCRVSKVGSRRDRTREGTQLAKGRGVKFGRKPILTPQQRQVARKRLEVGETQGSVAGSYNVSQSTISRL